MPSPGSHITAMVFKQGTLTGGVRGEHLSWAIKDQAPPKARYWKRMAIPTHFHSMCSLSRELVNKTSHGDGTRITQVSEAGISWLVTIPELANQSFKKDGYEDMHCSVFLRSSSPQH